MAGIREDDATAGTIEKRCAERRFQCGDVGTDSRLCELKFYGGAGETAESDDRKKSLKVLKRKHGGVLEKS